MRVCQLTSWSALACSALLIWFVVPRSVAASLPAPPTAASLGASTSNNASKFFTRVYHEIPKVDLATYARLADEIRFVRILGHESIQDEESIPFTKLQAEVLSTVKGNEAGLLELHIPGGEYGGHVIVAQEAPDLPDGSLALLFLYITPDGSSRGVMGLRQGTYRVDADPMGELTVVGLHTQGVARMEGFVERLGTMLEPRREQQNERK